MIGVIKGTGSSIPKKVLSNQDLSQMVDTSDTWIRERTGVSNRHIVEEETTVSMAVEAARKSLRSGNVKGIDIDMIIVATISSNVIMPSVACMVQKEIGAEHAVAFDMNAACSGFLFAYHTAQAYMASGMATNALIIGAESLSRIVNWTDRGTCILFGDGAGAVVLSVDCSSSRKQYPMIMHASGEKGSALICNTFQPGQNLTIGHYIQMNGQEVFKFAVRKVPEAIEELLGELQLEAEEIDYYILHQANQRIVESVAKRLSIGLEKFPMNLMEYGNTSSASIPILLDELNQAGKLKRGMKIVMVGFGAGLTWGAAYTEW